MDLGLTFCQAKIYLALVPNEACTARAISRISDVTRQDVYRITPILEKLGLVQKMLSIPNKWKATPIEEGLTILLERSNKRFTELKEKTTELLNSFQENNKAADFKEKSSEFVVVPGGETHRRWIMKKLEKAKRNTDAFITLSAHKFMLFNGSKQYKKRLKDNVRFRYIIYGFDETQKEIELEPELKENPGFQVRYIRNFPLAAIAVFDGAEVFVSNPTEDLLATPKLWSNNPHFVALIQEYFNVTWEKQTST
jgi:sugar-specific transcriptional regulator TrmB